MDQRVTQVNAYDLVSNLLSKLFNRCSRAVLEPRALTKFLELDVKVGFQHCTLLILILFP